LCYSFFYLSSNYIPKTLLFRSRINYLFTKPYCIVAFLFYSLAYAKNLYWDTEIALSRFWPKENMSCKYHVLITVPYYDRSLRNNGCINKWRYDWMTDWMNAFNIQIFWCGAFSDCFQMALSLSRCHAVLHLLVSIYLHYKIPPSIMILWGTDWYTVLCPELARECRL
jgi:hypothetical protein